MTLSLERAVVLGGPFDFAQGGLSRLRRYKHEGTNATFRVAAGCLDCATGGGAGGSN
jgi:hypothetical protein